MINYSIIVAASEDLTIGLNNKIPWHIPEDLKLFKDLTTGNIIIMGRKTFESIGKPLPGRTTIIITKDPAKISSNPKDDALYICNSLPSALDIAGQIQQGREIFIAGGASIYEQTISGAEKIYLSKIPGNYRGDTFFPEIPEAEWELESIRNFEKFKLEVYRRIQLSRNSHR